MMKMSKRNIDVDGHDADDFDSGGGGDDDDGK